MATEKYWKMPDHFDSNTTDIAVIGAGVIGALGAANIHQRLVDALLIDAEAIEDA